ncbi:hypothetical protein Desaci_4106 [Desulfosporosinus acidiphilus SJ4]|uniref:Uncharacterized protein n=1 Tax=Desulfosporosinus acidiphilus (strain DSM 22704 / JCM 16185 / SJ4) TaxID=646529 RepID=I4DAZ5_DESAJ|nr:hypothetical protein [Desulfosporosinus acidiphilus]AFM42969.1 hypothetical protein Desaci_4106 [Desulfosporosinus acidiphilus SJ4]
MSIWSNLSSKVNIDEEVLQLRALSCWILTELAKTDQEIAGYIQKYGVSSPEILEQQIKDKRVDGHPAWEDTIDWSNLQDYRKELLESLASSRGNKQNDD